MRLLLVTPPTLEPVTLSEVKSTSRVSWTDDDTNFLNYIAAAREIVESRINRQLISAQWQMSLDHWPNAATDTGSETQPWWVTVAYDQRNAIRFPWPPLIAVDSVSYVDTGGTTTVWPASNYRVSTSGSPGTLTLEYGKYWPPIRPVQDTITILFRAGYGTSPASVPGCAKTAIRMIVEELDRHRGVTLSGDGGYRIYQNPFGLDAILAPLNWGNYS